MWTSVGRYSLLFDAVYVSNSILVVIAREEFPIGCGRIVKGSEFVERIFQIGRSVTSCQYLCCADAIVSAHEEQKKSKEDHEVGDQLSGQGVRGCQIAFWTPLC
jgi:hypothetical protein